LAASDSVKPDPTEAKAHSNIDLYEFPPADANSKLVLPNPELLLVTEDFKTPLLYARCPLLELSIDVTVWNTN
jgi:hypothetical protein